MIPVRAHEKDKINLINGPLHIFMKDIPSVNQNAIDSAASPTSWYLLDEGEFEVWCPEEDSNLHTTWIQASKTCASTSSAIWAVNTHSAK
jgi:hypothetical protein